MKDQEVEKVYQEAKRLPRGIPLADECHDVPTYETDELFATPYNVGICRTTDGVMTESAAKFLEDYPYGMRVLFARDSQTGELRYAVCEKGVRNKGQKRLFIPSDRENGEEILRYVREWYGAEENDQCFTWR